MRQLVHKSPNDVQMSLELYLLHTSINFLFFWFNYEHTDLDTSVKMYVTKFKTL